MQANMIVFNRRDNSKGLAYIATQNTPSSKWCPWELGISDGIHGRACILPVMNNRYEGQEYLGLYPYLDYEKIKNNGSYEFWINDPKDNNKYTTLSKWLSE